MVRTIDTYIYYGHKHTMIMKGNGLFAVVLSAALLVSGCGSISDGGASEDFSEQSWEAFSVPPSAA